MSPASAVSLLLYSSASPFSLSADSVLSVPVIVTLCPRCGESFTALKFRHAIHSRELACRKTGSSHPRQQRCSGAVVETASPFCLGVPIAPSAKRFQDSVPDHAIRVLQTET